MNPSHDASASSRRGIKIPASAVGRRVLLILLDAGCYLASYFLMTVFTLAMLFLQSRMAAVFWS